MKIAVIGAGWAGLAAATSLKKAGLLPIVFEAAPVVGGRARGVEDLQLGVIDNGQHLMIGAYSATLALIQSLHPGVADSRLMQRMPFHLESADGHFCMHAPAIPSPLHSLLALGNARGLSWPERLSALRMMVALRLGGWLADAGSTVAQLIKKHRQSDTLCMRLWAPLCLATMNTAVHEACAQLFLNVLRDSLDARRAHSDLIVPRVDLTTLWPQAASLQMEMRYRHLVRTVSVSEESVLIDGEPFDACVLAIPPYAVARTLQVKQQQAACEALMDSLQKFSYRSIATLTLQLERHWRLPYPMMMLDEKPGRGHYGHWVFAREQHPEQTQLAVVISDAADFLKHDRADFVQGIASQIREQTAQHPSSREALEMPAVVQHRLIVEKRATFAATPLLDRPSVSTTWPRLALAGDWTDTGYPSVLEGAVRSGQAAAAVLLEGLKK